MWVKLLLAIGFVWFVQALLTYYQIKDYQKTSMALAKQGRLLIGTQRGYLSKGAILAMAVDEKFNILDCRLLNGISVMARFKKFEPLIGKNVLNEECKNGLKGSICKAYEKALSSLSRNKGEDTYGEITQVDSRE